MPATPGMHACRGWASARPRTSSTMSRMGRFQWQPNLAWCRSAPSSRRWFSHPALARPCSSSSSRPPGLHTAAISWRGAPGHATIWCAAAARWRPQRTQRFDEPRRRAIGPSAHNGLVNRGGASVARALERCAPAALLWLGAAHRLCSRPGHTAHLRRAACSMAYPSPNTRIERTHAHMQARHLRGCPRSFPLRARRGGPPGAGRARSVATGSACEHRPKVSTTVVKLAGGKARRPAVNGLSAGSPSRGGAATCAAAGTRTPASRRPAAARRCPCAQTAVPCACTAPGLRGLPRPAAGRWRCRARSAGGPGSAARMWSAQVHAACSSGGLRRQRVVQAALAYAHAS